MPVYDESFKNKFNLLHHLNPMGYRFLAEATASYIDYIIRHNMDDFKEVPYIGTDLHGRYNVFLFKAFIYTNL